MSIFCALSLLLTLAQTIDAAGPKCFSCLKVPFPRDCDTVVQCGDHEECGVEEVVLVSGHVVFNVGCQEKTRCQMAALRKRGDMFRNKRADILTCLQCCNEGFCNNQGCGMQGFDLNTRGPYCFHCNFQLGQTTCDTVTVCGEGQSCLLHATTPFPGVAEKVYKSGCVEAKQCSVLESMSVSADTCATCCGQDFCNTKCTNATTAPHTTKAMTVGNATTAPHTTKAMTVGNATTAPHTTKAMTVAPVVTSTHPPQPVTTKSQLPITTHAPVHTPDPVDAECHAHGQGYYNTHLQHSNLCVKMHMERKTWYEAVEICNKEKSRLVVVDTAEKDSAIRGYINTHASNITVWIGLNDRDNTSTFIWQSGDHLTYSDWGSITVQQPNDGQNGFFSQDCVRMDHHDNHRWHDHQCWDQAAFMCEKQTHPVNGGWTHYTQYCTCIFEGNHAEGHVGKRHQSAMDPGQRRYSRAILNSCAHHGRASGELDLVDVPFGGSSGEMGPVGIPGISGPHGGASGELGPVGIPGISGPHGGASGESGHHGGASRERIHHGPELWGHIKHNSYRSCMNPPPSGGGSMCGASQEENLSHQTHKECSSRDYPYV